MKNTLIMLALLVAWGSTASPVPQQRTRVFNTAAGTNQWLSSTAITNIAYTNGPIFLKTHETTPFFVAGDEISVAGFGRTGTNGIDGNRKIFSVSGNTIVLWDTVPGITNVGGTVLTTGFATLDAQFTSMTILANKSPRTANIGTVYLGLSTNEQSQPFALESGTQFIIEVPQWVSSTNFAVATPNTGDGVVITYFPK